MRLELAVVIRFIRSQLRWFIAVVIAFVGIANAVDIVRLNGTGNPY